jgi:hypothetical protein
MTVQPPMPPARRLLASLLPALLILGPLLLALSLLEPALLMLPLLVLLRWHSCDAFSRLRLECSAPGWRSVGSTG